MQLVHIQLHTALSLKVKVRDVSFTRIRPIYIAVVSSLFVMPVKIPIM